MLNVYLWDDVAVPKGVVQFCHGMSEYCGRYYPFAEFLNRNGYIVFGDDHRCHGKTETDANRGYHKGDVWSDTLKDLVGLHDYFRKQYKNLPFFFIGHSYGSFLGQAFLQQHTDIEGAVLTGTADMGAVAMTAATIATFPLWLFGQKWRPSFINKMSDLLFNGKYKPQTGAHLWLTRDTQEISIYEADPYAGINTSINFCWHMLNGVRKIYSAKALANLDPLVPVRVLSGSMDPIGGYGKKSGKLFEVYRKAGLDVEFKLYDGARHELLKEINKDEVYADILNFFNSVIAR